MPQAVSSPDDFTQGLFQTLVGDSHVLAKRLRQSSSVRENFIMTLIKSETSENAMILLLIRLEQLFPLPEKEITETINQYSNAKDIVWAQEEPRNMGAWGYLLLQLPSAVTGVVPLDVPMGHQRLEVLHALLGVTNRSLNMYSMLPKTIKFEKISKYCHS